MPQGVDAPASPALPGGTRLGPYTIEERIGAGGMGEVYRARDTRLGRAVAIKILPPSFASDAARRQRFEREARAVSALEHPHICVLHDIGSEAGVDYLVLELVEGQTLSARLHRGPLPLQEALRVGAEVAQALDAAHGKGIVHRDLKPGNVMLTRAGVKLLDFGVARLTEPASAAERTAETLTDTGTVCGTLAYMSPEQLERGESDARSDLWALGVVLYEMLTGRRAFEGGSAASLTAAILEHDPPALAAQVPDVSPALDRLVQRLLAKDPEERWQSARDVADELSWIAGTGVTPSPAPAASRSAWRSRSVLVTALAGLFAAGLAAGLWLRPLKGVETRPVTRTFLAIAPADGLGGRLPLGQGRGGIRTSLALSPDGRVLVFAGYQGPGRFPKKRQLYARRLDEPRAVPLPGTEDAEGPFFSPDGGSVGFWAHGHLWKVTLSGEPPISLCELSEAPHGAAWGGGRIVIGREVGGLMQLAENGGAPTPLTQLGPGEYGHRLPTVLPDGDGIVFTVLRQAFVWTSARVVAQSIRTGERQLVVEGGVDARYVPTGHLVFLRLGSLMAVPFDASHLQVHGSTVGLVDGVAQAAYLDNIEWDSGAGQYSVSGTGTLAFVRGPAPAPVRYPLVRVDRRGNVTPLTAPERNYISIRLAPDGRHAAVDVKEEEGFVLWEADLERGTLTRLGRGNWPVWSRDGRELAFVVGDRALFLRPSDGPPPAAPLIEESFDGNCTPTSWTPDGSLIYVRVASPGGEHQSFDVFSVATRGPRPAPEAVLSTPFKERDAELSPDGHWLAYVSDESGREEVYVQAYPGGRPRVQVSKEQGANPAWSRDGRELFYIAWQRPDPQRRYGMMSAVVSTQPRLEVGPSRLLFEFDNARLGMGCTPSRCYDVLPDGSGFLAGYAPEPQTDPVTQVDLVLNWAEELKSRVPADR